MEHLGWLSSLIAGHASIKYLIVFLGAAFGGEPAVIALSFLAAQGVFSIGPYFFASFAGVFCSDSLYFYLGRTGTARKLIEHRYAAKTISVIVEAIHRLSRGNHLAALIIAKFVVGTRAVIVMYVSKTGFSFGYFLRRNLLAILIWLVIVSSIGYLSGVGFTYVSSILENLYAGLGFLVLVVILLIIAQAWLKRAFFKEEEKVMEEEDVI